MQAFDQSSEMRTLTMPALTAQSKQYGKDEMPFLAFGGTEKPRNYVSEYMSGQSEHYDVNNAYGPLRKGAYDSKYGLIWDGERQIYDKHNKEANHQMFNMTKHARESMVGGSSGAVISKEGRTQCTPGYVMKNGECVMETTNSICQPGWRKVDGVCVKDPREFMDGKASGSMGTAKAATEYPMTKADYLSLKRLRQYVQEKETAESTAWGASGFWGILVIMIMIFVLIAVGSSMATQR